MRRTRSRSDNSRPYPWIAGKGAPNDGNTRQPGASVTGNISEAQPYAQGVRDPPPSQAVALAPAAPRPITTRVGDILSFAVTATGEARIKLDIVLLLANATPLLRMLLDAGVGSPARPSNDRAVGLPRSCAAVCITARSRRATASAGFVISVASLHDALRRLAGSGVRALRALRQRDDVPATIEPVAADIGRRVAYRPDATTGKTRCAEPLRRSPRISSWCALGLARDFGGHAAEDLAWLEAPPAKTLEQGQN